ncbi:MAG: response regulator [Halobacteriovoraceae bacterium]|jgi:CheY-like chemotaxis protein|nr:response regulator [Halobacteriovoraceae bacterium]MBT5094607.1 response regulator [Halobacteriovoraceae bacterium]
MFKKLLVVEDEAEIRVFISEVIDTFDIFTQIDQAENGQEALARISNNKYDLVIMDVQMPKMNGIEVLKHLPANETPCLLISGNFNPDVVEAAQKLGHKYLLVKPFRSKELFEKLKMILKFELVLK